MCINKNIKNDLEGYVDYLRDNNTTVFVIGRKIINVSHFIKNSESISRRGFKKYKTTFSENIAVDDTIITDICDYLNYMGVGYGEKRKKKKSLNKLSDISAKNSDIIKKYADWLNTEFDFSKNTKYVYIHDINNFFEYCTDFNNENAKSYIQTLINKGFKPATINLRITSLEKYALYAKRQISVKRVKFVTMLSLENIPTYKEYIKMTDYLRSHDIRYYYYIKILATTGIRISEFLKIKWSDVINGETEITGKGKKNRIIFFPKDLSEEVKKYRIGKEDGYLAEKNGRTISDRAISMRLKIIGRNVGIDSSKMHPHAFRHFFAKMYLKNNKDVVELANILGHRSVDTTRLYLQKNMIEQKKEFNKNVTW